MRLHLSSRWDWLQHIFFGLCIGTADLIPGVSGGSMALILGIYEKLIDSVKSLAGKDVLCLLFRCDWKTLSTRVPWDFLLGLFIGIVIALATLSQAIQWILGHDVYRIYFFSLFSGMIISCALICLHQLKDWKKRHSVPLVLGTIMTFLLTGPQKEKPHQAPCYHVHMSSAVLANASFDLHDTNIRNYDPLSRRVLNVSEPTLFAMLSKGYIHPETLVQETSKNTVGKAGDFVQKKNPSPINAWLIFCGSIAVIAMLLPGISGSYLLKVFGIYSLVISSLADFFRDLALLKMNGDAFLVLANVGTGVFIGALLFSHLIAWLLTHYRTTTMMTLAGFMLGALQTVWPFWTHTYLLDPLKLEKGRQLHLLQPCFPSIFSLSTVIAACFFVTGYLVVFILETLAKPTKGAHGKIHSFLTSKRSIRIRQKQS
ncbi:MAG: DUF368 domain-containing protein [Waddliaceae bacterium]